MKRTNVIAKPSAPLRKDVRQYRRYSNYDPAEAPIGPTLPNGGFTYNSGTGSGTFNWTSFVDSLLNSANTIIPSVWGNQNQWQVNALSNQVEAERKTNTILWVVIGLVLALLVFLVVRKTK